MEATAGELAALAAAPVASVGDGAGVGVDPDELAAVRREVAAKEAKLKELEGLLAAHKISPPAEGVAEASNASSTVATPTPVGPKLAAAAPATPEWASGLDTAKGRAAALEVDRLRVALAAAEAAAYESRAKWAFNMGAHVVTIGASCVKKSLAYLLLGISIVFSVVAHAMQAVAKACKKGSLLLLVLTPADAMATKGVPWHYDSGSGGVAVPLTDAQMKYLQTMQAARATALWDNAATQNITGSESGLVPHSQRATVTASFQQGTGELKAEYMADFLRTFEDQEGTKVTTLMPYHYCPGSRFEIISEIYIKEAMMCSITSMPGQNKKVAREVEFPNGPKLTLRRAGNGLGMTLIKHGVTSGMPHAPATSGHDLPQLSSAAKTMAHSEPPSSSDGALCVQIGARVGMLPYHLTNQQKACLWHARSGHASMRRWLETCKDKGHATGFELTKPLMEAVVQLSNAGCDVCAAMKLKRKPVGGQHSASTSVGPEQTAMLTLHKGERAAYDVKGPYPVASAQFNYTMLGMTKLMTSGSRCIGGLKEYTAATTQLQMQMAQALAKADIGVGGEAVDEDNLLEKASDRQCDEQSRLIVCELGRSLPVHRTTLDIKCRRDGARQHRARQHVVLNAML